MDASLARLLHAGTNPEGMLGLGLVTADEAALVLMGTGLALIAGGLYRLHTYEEPTDPIDEDPGA